MSCILRLSAAWRWKRSQINVSIKSLHDILVQAGMWKHFSQCVLESRFLIYSECTYEAVTMSSVCMAMHLCSTINYTQTSQQQPFTWVSFLSSLYSRESISPFSRTSRPALIDCLLNRFCLRDRLQEDFHCDSGWTVYRNVQAPSLCRVDQAN